MTTPSLSVVVSTIGRRDEFRRLVESVEACGLGERVELVVVDQSDDSRCARVLDERPWAIPVRATTSARGASAGRNAGTELAVAPVIAYPDDDAWYPRRTLARVIDIFNTDPRTAAICGRQITADGRPSMLRWESRSVPVTARNFLRTSIMSTMFFRRSRLDAVGGFDTGMGVGSAGWYGACEESDLLLRVIEAGGDVPYLPDLLVFQDEPRDDPDDAFVTKMLRYGCGQGHLWRTRSLPVSQLGYFCARKLAAAAVRASRGQPVLARADLAWLRGNIAGYRDVPPRELRHQAPVPR